MSTVIDARGRSCPEPVLMAKKACEQADQIEILVDNQTAVQNLMRLAKKLNRTMTTIEADEDYVVKMVK